ncbi:unnamed protein product [Prorocentrum cordatum]|uniref:Uncharacterized protein n=1 Tax=Prorocentrum cordatum TaxID=2364126 RepID=A0ABN9Q8Q6_9DINO|nr:unnamed protein product [Polarella glacialis]
MGTVFRIWPRGCCRLPAGVAALWQVGLPKSRSRGPSRHRSGAMMSRTRSQLTQPRRRRCQGVRQQDAPPLARFTNDYRPLRPQQVGRCIRLGRGRIGGEREQTLSQPSVVQPIAVAARSSTTSTLDPLAVTATGRVETGLVARRACDSVASGMRSGTVSIVGPTARRPSLALDRYLVPLAVPWPPAAPTL